MSANPQSEPYYGIPFLKRPTWKWQIASYFFLGGLAGGSFSLAALAGRFAGSEDAAALRQAGFESSLVALLPCPVLLVWDLGRPLRFHHMLRVWKPSSPMNLGSWLLTSFGAIAGIGAVHALGQADMLGPVSPWAQRLPMRAVSTLGLPLALGMTGYSGVLLAATSVPAWNQSPWLGGIFVASSFASAADLIHLHLTVRRQATPPLDRALERISSLAKAVETGLLLAHCLRSGRAGRALWWGRRGLQLWAGVGLGWAAAALAPAPQRLPSDNPAGQHGGRKRAIKAGLLALAGAFLIRWAIVHAGQESAGDPAAARAAARPVRQAPGWRASRNSSLRGNA
ncbi:MAG: NrfD/PsrC family molybdoenzyme membrane anchor subunit, partial [Terriglobales bacterium]